MKLPVLLGKIGLCMTLCAGLASADSLQLRNGRRLQGKYIGGTSTAIGFMSGASVEYFATTEVLIIMFDNASDSSLDGSQRPSPMSGDASSGAPRVNVEDAPDTLNGRAINRNRERIRPSFSVREAVSSWEHRKMPSVSRTSGNDRSFTLEGSSWFSWR